MGSRDGTISMIMHMCDQMVADAGQELVQMGQLPGSSDYTPPSERGFVVGRRGLLGGKCIPKLVVGFIVE